MSEEFTVTEAAMRPASARRECFYCQQAIGEKHVTDCVLIRRKWKVKLSFEHEMEFPADWDEAMVRFRLEGSSWCADNLIDEMAKAAEHAGCLCGSIGLLHAEPLSEPYRSEK